VAPSSVGQLAVGQTRTAHVAKNEFPGAHLETGTVSANLES
jgi:hypothetical protein